MKFNKNKTFIIMVLLFSMYILIGLSFNRISQVSADSGWDTDYEVETNLDYESNWDYNFDYDDNDKKDGSKETLTKGSFTVKELKKLIFFIIIILSTAVVMRLIYKLVLQPIVDRIYDLIFNDGKVSKKYNVKIVYKPFKYRQISQKRANKVIPNFDIEKFNFKSYEKFHDIQTAWMNFDNDKLKELLTDELYNMYVMELEVLNIKNQRNTMMVFELIDIKLIGLKKQKHQFIANVALNVKFYDYIEDINTREVLRGNDKKRTENTYILTFVKSVDDNKKEYCTQCGANVEGNTTGICQYCKSKLIFNNYDWVMSKKKKVSQRYE